MRILQVTHRYHPNIGGVEEHVKQISEHLVDRHNVLVLSADANSQLEDKSTINGVQVIRDYSFAPAGNLHFNPLSKVPSGFEPDVVHVHNYHSFPSHIHSFKTNKPVVFTPHYHGRGSSLLTNSLLLMLKPFGYYTMRSADAIIAMTDWERVELQTDFGAINVETIPHGMPEMDIEGGSGQYLLVVSRLEKYKNIDLAIKSLSLHDYNLIIVGNGPDLDRLKKLAGDLDVRSRCIFKSSLPRRELNAMYANAAATLNLSELEAFGMTVAESLCAGTPVVALPEKGLLRWTDTDGVIYASKNIQSVAKSIEIATDSTVDTSPLPTWSEVTKRIEKIYMEIT